MSVEPGRFVVTSRSFLPDPDDPRLSREAHIVVADQATGAEEGLNLRLLALRGAEDVADRLLTFWARVWAHDQVHGEPYEGCRCCAREGDLLPPVLTARPRPA